ncbi:hypothetical protein RN001_009866 [Aquatica leii]|uniref:Peptidase M14 domain-containing protein n=1 Tax=Aquatica leii TaxID=1421715 RepID=A0AAN7P050_9COLE|nr:hypothetical protein RN001_009866 [Aquatica leii]
MRLLVVVANFLVFVHSLLTDYEGYKVFRLYPKCEDDLSALVKLTESIYFDFWTPLKLNGKPLYVMVHPKVQEHFSSFLRDQAIFFYVFLDDIEMVIKKEKHVQGTLSELNCTMNYDRFDEIASYLNGLERNYPQIVKLKSVGKSYQKRKAKVCQISAQRDNNKPIIFITAGVYGREWFSVALAKYVIKELVENSINNDLLNQVDWHVLPVMNPDGYEYSHTHERFWRKNRSVQKDGCIGVDLNRNFNFHWGEVTGSSNPCTETFMGLKPFSESESKGVKEYFYRFKDRIKMYLSFHGFGTEILYPWGYTHKMSIDGSKLHLLAEDVSNAILDAGGEKYTVESMASPVNPLAGSSEDWVKGVGEVDYVFTISLPTGDYGYDPSPKKIISLAKPIFEGIKVFGKFITNTFGNVNGTSNKS